MARATSVYIQYLAKAAEGAGSRGGRVIGTTKSGKPIYAQSSGGMHKNFTPGDHISAAVLHEQKEKTQRGAGYMNVSREHGNQADAHREAAGFRKQAQSYEKKAAATPKSSANYKRLAKIASDFHEKANAKV